MLLMFLVRGQFYSNFSKFFSIDGECGYLYGEYFFCGNWTCE